MPLGLESMFVTAALLLCPEPATPTDAVSPLVEAVAPLTSPELEVVASSPLPAGHRVSSHYGYRTSPRTGVRAFHAGLDMGAAPGTPVYAVAGGVIERVAHNVRRTSFSGYGNAIVVHHPDLDRWSFYAHLEDVVVEEGAVVEPGQLIGHVGNSNNGRFPGMVAHLHFEVRVRRPDGGSPFPGLYRVLNVDPAAWFAELGVAMEYAEEDEHAHSHFHQYEVAADSEDAPVLTLAPARARPTTVAAVSLPIGSI
jgi:murein DD-endopeptidase MepM/ murein hydrolase activator NlpD